MKSIKTVVIGLLFIGVMVVVPRGVFAQTISLDSITPEVDSNITPSEDEKGADENFYTYWLIGQIGNEYRAVFNVSEEPAMTFVSGGDMTIDSNVEYDEEEGQFIVTYTALDLQQIDEGSEKSWTDEQTLTVIALSFPVAEGEDGPGENMKGSWVATAFQEWTLIMPSETSNQLGARVTGDALDEGQFKMFVPQNIMNDMAEYDEDPDGEFSADNLAIYQDDELYSGDVSSVEGGAFVSFETTLPAETNDGGEGSGDEEGDCSEGDGPVEGEEEGEDPCAGFGEESFDAVGGPGVSQNVTTAPRAAIAVTFNKTRVKKAKKVRVTGWLKNGKKNQKVVIQRKIPKAKKASKQRWHKLKVVKTKAGGKFTTTVKISKKTFLRAKRKGKKAKTTGQVIKVR